MKLSRLIERCALRRLDNVGEDPEILSVSADSRSVSPGTVFVAVSGPVADGHCFILQAIAAGACAVVVDKESALPPVLPAGVAVLKSEDSRIALGSLCAEFFGRPSERLKVVGITGTNGKTTLTYLLEAILSSANSRAGVIGTVNYRLAAEVFPAHNTTPGAGDLQKLLAMMADKKADYVLMEVSSHALQQRRTAGVVFHSAIFTNLTQDHLDYHRTKEEYFLAKSLLFTTLAKEAVCFINLDDDYGRRLLAMSNSRAVTYGLSASADVRAENIRNTFSGSEFLLRVKGAAQGEMLRCGLIGRHNIYNILAAVAWALAQGIDIAALKKVLAGFSYVPGRLERIGTAKGFNVFVDYAHTPDALEKVICSLREVCPGRIIIVFGCGGERDRMKRRLMGGVVSKLADFAVITNDNPRSEDPAEIIREIEEGMIKDGNYCVIQDRRSAIIKAIASAGPGDVVLVAGKGHEDYQIIGDQTIHFDDREVLRECLR